MKDQLLKVMMAFIAQNPGLVKSFKTTTNPYIKEDKSQGFTYDFEIEFFESEIINNLSDDDGE